MSFELDDDTVLTSALGANARLFGAESSAAVAPSSYSREAIYNYIKGLTDSLYPTQSELSSLDDYVQAFALLKADGTGQWDGQSLRGTGFADGLVDTDLATYGQLQAAVLSTTFDIPGLTAIGTIDSAADLLLIYDTSAAAYRKATPIDLIASLDADLAALAALSGTGGAFRTASDTWALRTLTAPAAGLAITNPAGVAGDPTFALANDLAALEALSGTNTIYYRSAADTWTAVTIGSLLSFSAGTLNITDAELAALAGLTSAADSAPYFTGSGTAALMTVTSAARTILDDASVGAIATTLGLGTGNSPQFTGIELGAASDTTLARVSAGLISVEGVTVALISTAQVLTNKSVDLASNTLTGTTAQFNTALSDGDFATLAGSEALTNKTLTAAKIASGGFLADANGNELLIFTTTASAVNELTYANGATGVNPKWTASGETNVGMDFQAKGSGTYRFLGTSTQAAQLRLYEDTDDGSNYSAFRVGTQAADITYTLPTAVGGANTFLKDVAGDGVLSWAAVTASITGGDTQVTFFDGANNPAGDAGLTYNKATDALTAAGVMTAAGFAPTDTAATGNRLYLPAANTLGFAINGSGEVQLTATALSPITNDGNALGTSALGWADADFASGAVIRFNNADTITHSASLFTFSTPVSLGTSNAFTCGTIELGAASDTTISRSAAGVIAVEGVPLFSNIPQNSQSTAYTTVLGDAQKHILHPTADNNARTFTIDSNANVAYPIGTAITFVNQINTVTIAITSDTMTLAGTGGTGSRTLAANGIATALKIATTSWVISGTGLS